MMIVPPEGIGCRVEQLSDVEVCDLHAIAEAARSLRLAVEHHQEKRSKWSFLPKDPKYDSVFTVVPNDLLTRLQLRLSDDPPDGYLYAPKLYARYFEIRKRYT